MTLLSLLKDYPNISLATEGDNEEILEYYHRSQLTTSSHNIIYKRGRDFFSFMKEKSSEYLVFLLRDEQETIQGIATVSYRDGYINSKLVKVGYLGDLRISLNRKLIRQWRGFFSLFINNSKNLEETFHCRHYQTALVHDNVQSRNNLANSKIKGIKYSLLEDYHMVNIVGSYGFRKSQNYKIDKVTQENIVELINFLESDHKLRSFGLEYKSELSYRFKNWEDYSKKNWILLRDPRTDEILAATSLWGPKSSKQLLISGVPTMFKLLKVISKYIPFLDVFDLPQEEKAISIKYINQVSFKEDISRIEKGVLFKELVNYFYCEFRGLNLLAYCDFDRENFKSELKGYFTHATAMGLYTVHKVSEDGETFDIIEACGNMPAFDMALV
ncbi:hypothetical protein A9Q84_19700 [Halobacteriovorax marinus]|uniref:Uncharacterized protein n=1 Tax=Halobacteriovorax marinus TaxID=97084 RepID=A0A1Y5F948_9BACT|nr:hypothetical protein A9Q84_19700 [Halobacteriovorax marinus]